MKNRRRFAWIVGVAAAIVTLGALSARSYAPYWHPSDSFYPR